jgi:hypothetical protein
VVDCCSGVMDETKNELEGGNQDVIKSRHGSQLRALLAWAAGMVSRMLGVVSMMSRHEKSAR